MGSPLTTTEFPISVLPILRVLRSGVYLLRFGIEILTESDVGGQQLESSCPLDGAFGHGSDLSLSEVCSSTYGGG